MHNDDTQSDVRSADYEHIKTRLRRAYDSDIARRDALTPPAWRIELVDQFAADLRQRRLRRVIELGAGAGQLAERLRVQGLDVLATDLSPESVAALRRRGLDAEVVDFSALPYANATFDAAFAMNALLHVPKDRLRDTVRGIRRILRPGGLLLYVVWGGRDHEGPFDHEWLDPPRLFFLYDDASFSALTFEGFETLRSTVHHDQAAGDLHQQVKLLEAI